MPRGICYASVKLKDLTAYFASPDTEVQVNRKWAINCKLIKDKPVEFEKVTGRVTDGVVVESFED